jgi:hypothetical protein
VGFPLQQAKGWLAIRAEDLAGSDLAFIADSIKHGGIISQFWAGITLRLTKRPIPKLPIPKRPTPKPRGPNVFISYRRMDTAQIAGRVYDRLAREIPEDEIFFDVDTIPIGVDFRQNISSTVNRTAVLLVLVGERWLSLWKRSGWLLGSKSEEDFVQLEIELALASGVPILPLLVENVAMPRAGDLPSAIEEFVSLNAARIRSGRDFNTDMVRVLERIKQYRKPGTSPKDG